MERTELPIGYTVSFNESLESDMKTYERWMKKNFHFSDKPIESQDGEVSYKVVVVIEPIGSG